MSALPPKADMAPHYRDVRFVPIADSCTAATTMARFACICRAPAARIDPFPPGARRWALGAHKGNAAKAYLFDYLAGALLEEQRHVKAKRFSSFEVDHEVELDGRLHGQFAGLCALENAIDIICRASKVIGQVVSVRQQSAFSSSIDTDRQLAGGSGPLAM
jgi:hypothetical protein